MFARTQYLLPRCVALVAVVFALLAAARVEAARPEADHLFPKQAYAYLRIANLEDLKERFQKTSMGRMLQDPQLVPLLQQIYDAINKSLSAVEDTLGMSTTELLSIPQGEIAVALIPPDMLGGGRQISDRIKLVMLVDVGDRIASASQLIDKLVEQATSKGAIKDETTINDNKLVSLDFPTIRVEFCLKDGAVVLSTAPGLVGQIVTKWGADRRETLADNENFAAVMRHCPPENGPAAQMTVFVDPIGFIKDRSSEAGDMVSAVIATIGLDGLRGIGGSISLAEGEFDDVMHFHLMLDNPRNGALALLAMTSGDTTPERWVPSDAGEYRTIHWDVTKTFQQLAKIIDGFSGEGFLSRKLQEISKAVGADFEKEVFPALAGRFSHVTWVERPIVATSQVTVVSAQLKDPESFAKVLEQVTTKLADQLEVKPYGGVTYYAFNFKQMPGPDEQPWRHTSFGIVGNCFLMADRTGAMERAITTQLGDTSQTLASALEFKLIANKIARQPGGKQPGMVTFRRPDEGLRMLYELAASDKSQTWLKQQEKNPFFKRLGGALESNPLPPFAVLSKYLAPGGAFVTDEETGFHYMSFSLKRE